MKRTLTGINQIYIHIIHLSDRISANKSSSIWMVVSSSKIIESHLSIILSSGKESIVVIEIFGDRVEFFEYSSSRSCVGNSVHIILILCNERTRVVCKSNNTSEMILLKVISIRNNSSPTSTETLTSLYDILISVLHKASCCREYLVGTESKFCSLVWT